MTKTINNPHDKVFKSSLSNIEVAKDFFKAHLPDSIQKHVSFSSLKLTQGSFVDKQLREHLTDLLYEVDFDSRKGYLYLLLESQSTPDKLLPFRLLQYTVQIMNHDLKRQQRLKKTKVLPVIYPMVYYHGNQSPYPYSMDIFQCFADPEWAKQHLFKPAQLVDLSVLSDDEILKHKLVGALEFIQKNANARDMFQALQTMIELKIFQHIEKHSSNYLEAILTYLLHQFDSDKIVVFMEELSKQLTKTGGKKMMTMAERLKLMGEERGIEKGLKRGLSRGLSQGLSQGKEEGLLLVARNLLKQGQTIQFISNATGLSQSKLKSLLV